MVELKYPKYPTYFLVTLLSIIITTGFLGYTVGWEKPDLINVVEKTLPSCVHVRNLTSGGQGSGFAIAKDIVLTAAHVVSGGGQFEVTSIDGTVYKVHKVLRRKDSDVAYLKLKQKVLKPLITDDLEDVKLGQSVFLIGGPLGFQHWPSVTAGIVSSLGVKIDANDIERYDWRVLWQVDAASYPGNSGGPIITLDGVVRGILVGGPYVGQSLSECISYCVPMELIVTDIKMIHTLFAESEYKIITYEERSI